MIKPDLLSVVSTALLFVYGAVIGSFLGVVIERLPKGESIVRGRSHCDHCRKTLRWFELIPLISFLIQKGKCARCHTQLSWRYPLLEILTGILFALIWLTLYPSFIALLFALLIACVLIVIVFIDLDYMIIPDSMVVMGTIAAVGYQLTRPAGTLLELLQNAVPSGIISMLLFYGLWLLTKKKGIGFGDVKLVLFLGIVVGFPRVVGSLYLAFLTGALFALILVFRGKKTMKSAVPFGPFLVLGLALSFIFPIQDWIFTFL